VGSGKKILLVLLIVSLLFSSGRLLTSINEQRERYNLTVDLPLEDAPPELILMTTALGGFRGLIVNYLWVRAMELQQEGNYFELVQLFDWIGKLQPRFETVWVYAGWNMAYNISVKLTTPSERWAWISRGIEILRDEGLRYNPENPRMYKELAWIYFHKIGMLMDEFHWEYKFYLADQMGRVVGPDNVFLPDIAELYGASRAELLQDSGVSEISDRISEEGIDPFGKDFSRMVLGYKELPEELVEVFEDESLQGAAGKLLNFIRMRELTESFNLNPARMMSLREEYGPLDWRLAQSIALYWLTRGIEAAEGEQDINHDRMILHCLISLTENGRLVVTEAGMPVTEPDFRFLRPTDRFYSHLVEKYEQDTGLASAHENFLQTMVVNLFTYGREDEAGEAYTRLRELKPGSYRASLEDFVINRIMERVGDVSVPEISSLIRGLIRQALYELALGNDERAQGMEDLARLVWTRHMRQYEGSPRMHLPPYDTLREDVASRALDGEFPEELLPYLRKRLRRDD
jgi:hypothetical protein